MFCPPIFYSCLHVHLAVHSRRVSSGFHSAVTLEGRGKEQRSIVLTAVMLAQPPWLDKDRHTFFQCQLKHLALVVFKQCLVDPTEHLWAVKVTPVTNLGCSDIEGRLVK